MRRLPGEIRKGEGHSTNERPGRGKAAQGKGSWEDEGCSEERGAGKGGDSEKGVSRKIGTQKEGWVLENKEF
jgi:hypothetical protein